MGANLVAGTGLFPVDEILQKTKNQELISTEEYEAGCTSGGIAETTTIIFVISGSCALRIGKTKELRLKQGSVVILPIASKYTLRVNERLQLAYFFLSEILNHSELLGHLNVIRKATGSKSAGSVLQMDEKLWMFITNTLSFVNDGLSSIDYQKMKVGELFHVLNAYYSNDTLSRFFNPLLSRNPQFAAYVYDNWRTAETLDDLALQSGLSLSGFSKRFKKVFGIAPYKWIVEQKSRLIINDLLFSDKSIKEITTEHKFYSVQHFGYYCKQKYGCPPGKLRKLVKIQNEG